MSRLAGAGLVVVTLVLSVLFVGCPNATNHLALLPEASFECNPASGYLPLVVQFRDVSEPGTSAIREWVWSFGDGATSTERNPKHTYYVSGQYAVSLRVTSGVGTDSCSSTYAVTVKQPSIVASFDTTGGSLEVEGASLTAPAGALEDSVVVSGVYNEGTVPVRTGESELLVSDVYEFGHDQADLYLNSSTPLTLEIPFTTEMVPESGRTPAQLQIIALLDSGISVPIIGQIGDGVVTASLAGLPHWASYGVVYRPQMETQSLDVEELTAKTTTSYRWRVDDWRLLYSDARLQELTALRIGNLTNTSAYIRRDWSLSQTAQTLTTVEADVADLHVTARDAGFISPMLLTSPDYEYTLIFHPLNATPVTEYDSLSDVTFATSIFGDLVIDAAQLAAISKCNATGSSDQKQEVEFPCAFSQALFRACFRGYDLPEYTQASSTDLDAELEPRNILFSQGFEDGLATYLGQLAVDITRPRSLGANEYSLISESLFAPWSASGAGYSYATQDFFFYLTKRFTPSDPLTYISDSYEGVLDMIRTRTGESDVTSYADAANEARTACAVAVERILGISLSDVYWEYARDRAYENGADSLLRVSDNSKDPYTLNTDQFTADAIVEHAYGTENEVFTVSATTYPTLATVPPLATRALVLTPGDLDGELQLSIDAYDWKEDDAGRSMKVLVYREKMQADETYEPVGSPVELTASDAELSLDGFGSDEAATDFDRAVVLIANVTYDQTYAYTFSATLVSTSVEATTGTLVGIVSDAATAGAVEGASVTVRRIVGDVVGSVVGTATTNSSGMFTVSDLAVGDIQVTLWKTNYVTKLVETVIAGGETTVMQVSLVPAAKSSPE